MKTLRILAPVVTATGIAALAMSPRMPVVFGWDKADHVVAFGGLAGALLIATRRPLHSFLAASGAAAAVEMAQGAFPSLGRECSWTDLLAGVAGAAGVCLAARLVRPRGSDATAPGPEMRVVDIRDFGRDLERRRRKLGIVDTPESIDALRNRGHRRTESKKLLLREIARRSREQGVEPPPAYIDGERV